MSQPSPSPDDRRILDELEQLRGAIRASRTREPAGAAFDSEPRAFELRHTAAPASPPAAGSAIEPGGSRSFFDELPPPVALPEGLAAEAVAVRPRSSGWLVAGCVAVVALAALVFVWSTQRGPGSGPTAPVAAPPASAAGPAAEAPPLKPVPVADPHAVRIDLTSLRRVWLRVSVDGRIALEREVAGGERLPFGADKSIVVRAGDAGAVTVRVGAEDQGPLGRDGQVLNREFTVPAR